MPVPKTVRGIACFMGALVWCAPTSAAASEAVEAIAVDNIGVPLYTHNFDTGQNVSIANRLYASEFVGGHYYVTKSVRVGLMLQWTEQYAGDLAPGADHFTTFALLPQIGWNFYDHFCAAAVFAYAPRAGGKDQYDLGVQAVLGYGVTFTRNVSLNLLVEAPYNFRLARTIGITPLIGLTLAM